jgi:NTE family protein
MSIPPQGAAASGRVAHARTEGSKTVSLVLGSGGARGLAHIGVIQWLLENGYEIAFISGTSIGALVGGIYASHKLDVYAQWVLVSERKHVLRLLDPTSTSLACSRASASSACCAS